MVVYKVYLIDFSANNILLQPWKGWGQKKKKKKARFLFLGFFFWSILIQNNF